MTLALSSCSDAFLEKNSARELLFNRSPESVQFRVANVIFRRRASTLVEIA